MQGIDSEDLKTLHEIGVLQPDHALKLSDILLGATRGNPRKRGRGDEKQSDTTKSHARGKREDVL